MKHAANYRVVISDQGIPVLVLPYSRLKPENPILLYDGGQHITLFRNDHDTLLVDFLPEEALPYFQKNDWCVVLEQNKTADNVVRDYKVLIKRVKHNPLTDGI